MITKKAITRAFVESGLTNVSLWYDRSACQWVFTGAGTCGWYSTSTYVYRLDQLTVEQWVDHARNARDGEG